jgi:hypothetical protein
MNEELQILRELNNILDLGDLVYNVREREGLGWEGPQVKAWDAACTRMKKLFDEQDRDHEERIMWGL